MASKKQLDGPEWVAHTKRRYRRAIRALALIGLTTLCLGAFFEHYWSERHMGGLVICVGAFVLIAGLAYLFANNLLNAQEDLEPFNIDEFEAELSEQAVNSRSVRRTPRLDFTKWN